MYFIIFIVTNDLIVLVPEYLESDVNWSTEHKEAYSNMSNTKYRDEFS
mgnify:CR=1 FL=1